MFSRRESQCLLKQDRENDGLHLGNAFSYNKFTKKKKGKCQRRGMRDLIMFADKTKCRGYVLSIGNSSDIYPVQLDFFDNKRQAK